ncbi:MAG TPA: hypothetical protein VGK02_03185 [Candidatus Aquicultor sp.]|jgi:hypothetical protein
MKYAQRFKAYFSDSYNWFLLLVLFIGTILATLVFGFFSYLVLLAVLGILIYRRRTAVDDSQWRNMDGAINVMVLAMIVGIAVNGARGQLISKPGDLLDREAVSTMPSEIFAGDVKTSPKHQEANDNGETSVTSNPQQSGTLSQLSQVPQTSNPQATSTNTTVLLSANASVREQQGTATSRVIEQSSRMVSNTSPQTSASTVRTTIARTAPTTVARTRTTQPAINAGTSVTTLPQDNYPTATTPATAGPSNTEPTSPSTETTIRTPSTDGELYKDTEPPRTTESTR